MTLSNNPPDMAVTAIETMQAISAWMKETPVIATDDKAREAKVLVDRGKLCIKDLEDERGKKVKPLNDQVKEINEYYRAPRSRLEGVLDEIGDRLSAFLRAEERKRQEAAAAARRAAEEAARIAAEAEANRQKAKEEAAAGVLDVDMAEVVEDIGSLQNEAERAARRAALADRETKVKIGGGFMKATSLRTEVILEVIEPYDAIEVMGLTEYIAEGIIKSARQFKREHGEYPPGIRVTEERKVK